MNKTLDYQDLYMFEERKQSCMSGVLFVTQPYSIFTVKRAADGSVLGRRRVRHNTAVTSDEHRLILERKAASHCQTI